MSNDLMPDPKEPSKTISQAELYKRTCEETQFKINSLDYNQEGSYEKLIEWQRLIEAATFVDKVAGTRVMAKIRELDEKAGRNRWDKETRGLNRSNGSVAETVNKVKKVPQTPLEKLVSGYISLWDESEGGKAERDEYILSMTVGRKYTADEVKDVIRRLDASGTVVAKTQE